MTQGDAARSIVERLALVPPGVDAALVLRHAEREAIPSGTFGEDVRLTSQGVAAAERLGSTLSVRDLAAMRSSPLVRCLDTARAMARGAGWEADVVPDRLLGDPGPFVVDPEISGPLFLEVGIRELARWQLDCGDPPPGMRPTNEGAELLLNMIAGGLGRNGRLHVHVTHDAILAVLAGDLYRLNVDGFGWPGYLDGLLLWRSGGLLHFSWPGLEQGSHPIGG